MVIRVDSLENLLNDTAYYLDKTENELLQDIRNFDFRNGDDSAYAYIRKHKCHSLDDIYLCHIARKLDCDNGMTLKPLNEVLLSENPFSGFLKDRNIEFQKDHDGMYVLLYNQQYVGLAEKRQILSVFSK